MLSRIFGAATFTGLLAALFLSDTAFAHDPVFSPGPHVLFKDGIEVHAEYARHKARGLSDNEASVAIKYGLTGNWVVGLELPYEWERGPLGRESGVGAVSLSTKYRFWRSDRKGVQESAAILAQLKLDTGGFSDTSTNDLLVGLAYGYESLKWYRWASVRYLFNDDAKPDRRGDRLFVDLAVGWRPKVNDYRSPDTVWMVELNGELTQSSTVAGLPLADSGGDQWFVSPGVMWTLRNLAVKAGVQIPIISKLNGDQAKARYRGLVGLEWHF
ncbi:transporter [Kordiimonas lacus]|uniref:Putative MetA-pathway of phenol degradation n=1 Tax=Kordiimonas lacus TaxID=637679 RepID=A0A1G6WJM7_9PROT|nr:transporter [Kordiimonas lacus]SDD66004.1 Putative MetA-pathway of phenol degradation [Kordiimonas lacus]